MLPYLASGKKNKANSWGVVVFTIAATVVLTILTVGSAAGEAPLIGSDGLWTLEDLGHGDIQVPVQGEVRSSSPISYLLPDDAVQGHGSWYMLFLHFILELGQDSSDGRIYVAGKANDRAAAQVKFTRSGHTGGTLWSTTELLSGGSSGFSLDNSLEVYYINYIPNDGVLPRLNELTFQLEQYDGAKVERLSILRDSGIIRTKLGPPKIQLGFQVPKRHLDPGDEFTIDVVLSNAGWPAKEVELEASYPREALEMITPNSMLFPSLGERHKWPFTFRLLQTGRHVIQFRATGKSGGNVLGEVQVQSNANEGGRNYLGLRWYYWIGIDLILAIVLFALLKGLLPRITLKN